jgi:predicted ATPase
VLAGLAILDGMAGLNERLAKKRGPQLAARVGIHNGSVVAESDGKSVTVFGDVTHVASRVQSAAAPNTVVITAAVHRLISGWFLVEDQGTQRFKGIAQPIQLFRAIQPSGARGRLAASVFHGLTAFVGRDDEIRLLLDLWERVRSGQGQLVLISGEPGIGKSRLIQHFQQLIAEMPHTWAESAAAALHQNTPFYSIEDLLQQGFRWRGEETPEERIADLEMSLKLAGVDLVEAVPLIAPLMSLPVPTRYMPLQVSADQQRKKLLATIANWALGSARIQPVVIVVEDLHWADPSTLEVIQLIAEQNEEAQLLLICTARQEFRPTWVPRTRYAQLPLDRLSSPDTRTMVSRLTVHMALAAEIVEALVRRSGGVPLFIEELTRAVIESDDLEQASREIPTTLYDSLMARLDRLGEARQISQIASVIGNEFSWELLSTVAAVDEGKLEAALHNLVDSGIVLVEGSPPAANYRFRHALIRDAAYRSLLRVTRRQYHRQIADILKRSSGMTTEAAAELLAHHYTEADLKEQAIAQWQRAGLNAMQRSANAEAVNHLSKAVQLVELLPESRSRAQQELELQVTLGVPLMLSKGYAAPELEKVYSRARELYQQVGESPQFFPMLFGMWAFYSVRAEYSIARELGEQLVSLAESTQDPALLTEAHAARGNTFCFAGELIAARRHLEQAIAHYDPQQHRSHAFVYGQDPGVHSLSYATLALWLLGYPDQARKRSLEVLALAQELSHPYSLAFALVHVLYVHRFSRELTATEERASELLALSAEHGFPITLAVGAAHLGWALSEQGRGEDGIIQIRQGIDAWRATGATLFFQPFLLAILAEAYGKARSPKQGLAELVEALAIANRTGERFWESELYRLSGELTLQCEVQGSQPNREKAKECFHRAIDIARQQNAKSLELRAAISLVRLTEEQGRNSAAEQMLAETYGWFTEGFDTVDLKTADVLLKDAR